jgi:hypothetical protein
MHKTPPQFVPTLTHVVAAQPAAALPNQPAGAIAAVAVAPVLAQAGMDSAGFNAISLQLQQRVLQDVTERVMQQIESTLERHIREAVSGVALAHAKAIANDLAPAIESVVTDTLSQALQDALAKELADKSGYR